MSDDPTTRTWVTRACQAVAGGLAVVGGEGWEFSVSNADDDVVEIRRNGVTYRVPWVIDGEGDTDYGATAVRAHDLIQEAEAEQDGP